MNSEISQPLLLKATGILKMELFIVLSLSWMTVKIRALSSGGVRLGINAGKERSVAPEGLDSKSLRDDPF